MFLYLNGKTVIKPEAFQEHNLSAFLGISPHKRAF